MLKIRLARLGKKKKPTYSFIVSESARDPYGKALEILGHYNPFSKVTEVKKDRILYWISQGAKLSATVHNMLIDQNVIQAPKVKASKSGKKKSAEGEKAAKDKTGGKTADSAAEALAKAPSEAKAEEPKGKVDAAEKPEAQKKEEKNEKKVLPAETTPAAKADPASPAKTA